MDPDPFALAPLCGRIVARTLTRHGGFVKCALSACGGAVGCAQNMPSIARQITPAETRRILSAQERVRVAEQRAADLMRRASAARDQEIARAVEAGASTVSIGRALSITRQAVSLAVRRARDRQNR